MNITASATSTVSNTTNDVFSLAAWMSHLTGRGYVAGAPSAAAARIDGDMVAASYCEACNQHGLDYRPFTLPARDGERERYVALGCCPTCGNTTEF
jgi:cytochrome c5